MDNHSLQRFGGLAWLVAGPLFTLALCFHPDEQAVGAVLASAWAPVHLAMLAAFVLMVPGSLAVHARLRAPGRLARVGLPLVAIGGVLAAVIAGVEAFSLPALLGGADKPMMEAIFASPVLRPIGLLFAIGVPAWIAGYVLTGLALRGEPMLRTPATLLAVGAVLVAVPVHAFGVAAPVVKLLLGGTYGTGLAWIGLRLARVGAPAVRAVPDALVA